MNESIFIGAAVVWFLSSLTLIIWLLRDKSELKGEVEKLKGQIHNLLKERKEITFKVVGHKEHDFEKTWGKKKERVEIGYRIQYFVDGIPFVQSGPTIMYYEYTKEVDQEMIDRLIRSAVEAGLKLMLDSPANFVIKALVE